MFDLLQKNKFLKQLYNEQPPLDSVLLFQILLGTEYSKFSCDICLPVLPDNLPKKWHPTPNNGVIIKLTCHCLRAVAIDGWFDVVKGEVKIKKEDDLLLFSFKGQYCKLDILSELILVDSVIEW